MNCSKIGCKDAGDYNVLMVCPAVREEGKKFPDAVIHLGLPLCKRHAKKFDALAFVNTQIPNGKGTNRVLFEMGLREYGATPNFDRLYVEAIRADSERSKKFTIGRLVGDVANKPIPPKG